MRARVRRRRAVAQFAGFAGSRPFRGFGRAAATFESKYGSRRGVDLSVASSEFKATGCERRVIAGSRRAQAAA